MDFRLTVPELASNCWPGTPQSFVNEIFEKTRGQLEDLEGVIISDSTPSASDQDRLWIKTDVNGIPIGQFLYALGQWIWPLEGAVQRASELMMWEGTLASIITIDGGSAGAVTLTTGPFWEIHSEFVGRSPMAVGTIPTSNPSKTLAVEEDYGEGAHALTEAELPTSTHKHLFPLYSNPAATSPAPHTYGSGPLLGVSENVADDSVGTYNPVFDYTEPVALGDGDTMPVIHPVRGVYILRRTGRLYLVG